MARQIRHNDLPASLGIDPALTGGAVLLWPGGPVQVLGAWWWQDRTRRRGGESFKLYELVSWLDGQPRAVRETRCMSTLGAQIREEARVLTEGRAALLGAEEAVVGRARDTSIVVARNAGRVVGPCEVFCFGFQAVWVRATTWRKTLLGLPPNTTRKVAKARSKRDMPVRVRGLDQAIEGLLKQANEPTVSGRNKRRLLTFDDLIDVADAAGVAEWRRLAEVDPTVAASTNRNTRKGGSPKKSPPPGAPRLRPRYKHDRRGRKSKD